LTGLTLSGILNGTTVQAATIGNTGSTLTGTLQTAAQTNITSVGTLTGLTLSGTLNGTTIQAATFGNSGAVFTGATYTASSSFNGPHNGTLGSAGGNTAIVSTLSATGNATISSLAVNNSMTVGSTLGVTSNIIGNGYISANNQVIIQAPSPSLEGAQIVLAWANTSGLTGQGNSTWNIDVDAVANLRLFYQDAAGSTSVPFRITQGGGVGNIYMPGNIFVGGYFYSNGSVFSGGGGGGGSPGGNNTDIQYNSSGVFAGASFLHYISGNGQVVANAGISSTSTGTGSFIATGGIGASGNVTADIIHAVNNGNGTNFQVGDDAWIGDINVANTMRVAGQQDSTQGYIVFGNTNQLTLGRSGSGALTYQGAFTAQGGVQNTPIGNATASTGQFTTIGATGTFTGTTINAATIGNASATHTGATYYASGNYYGILGGATNANAATVTTLSANGNATVNGLTVNTSGVFTTTVQAAGGLQSTPIGNVAGQASTGSFTTITANGNLTVAAITSNGTITATTIGAATIGNTGATLTGTLSTAAQTNITSVGTLTGLTLSGALTGTTINAATIGNASTIHIGSTYYASGNYYGVLGADSFANAATVTTLSANGNITASALTVNNSVTIGTTLGVSGNVKIGSNITLAGNVGTLPSIITNLGGVNTSYIKDYYTDANSPTREVFGIFPFMNIKYVNGAYSYSSATSFQIYDGSANPIGQIGFAVSAASAGDPTLANVTGGSFVITVSNANTTTSNVNGDFLVRTLGPSGPARFRVKYDGNIYMLGNTTVTTTLQAFGGLQNTAIGNVAGQASTGSFTTITANGNVTASALTVNNSATVGTTLAVTGNANVGNITIVGTTSSTSNVTGAVQVTGGVGVGGNVYVGNRVGWVYPNNTSSVYQVYNNVTASLDTIFG
jgi:hypothetical protein